MPAHPDPDADPVIVARTIRQMRADKKAFSAASRRLASGAASGTVNPPEGFSTTDVEWVEIDMNGTKGVVPFFKKRV